MAARDSSLGACTSQFPSRPSIGRVKASRSGYAECGHQLEKLEFALAIAETRGDQDRCSALESQIADLGGNAEEPGT